jgi:hypothetical protein
VDLLVVDVGRNEVDDMWHKSIITLSMVDVILDVQSLKETKLHNSGLYISTILGYHRLH